MKKVLFISSTGGHLEELTQLKDMFKRYDYYIVTEKTKSNLSLGINFCSFIYINNVLWLTVFNDSSVC